MSADKLKEMERELDRRNEATKVWIQSDTQCRAYANRLEREVERLRVAYTRYEEHHVTTCESLQKELAEAQAEVEAQARLNGMGSEREARLMAQVEELKKERDDAQAENARLQEDNRKLCYENVRWTLQNGKYLATLESIQAEIDRGKQTSCIACCNGSDLEYDPLTNTHNGFCRACWRIWENGKMYLLWDWQTTEARISEALSKLSPSDSRSGEGR